MLTTLRHLFQSARVAATTTIRALRHNPAALAVVASVASLALLAWLEP